MGRVKCTTKCNMPAIDMHGSELLSREPAAVITIDWKPPPPAPMESLHALAKGEILLACSKPITGYNKTTIAAYFCPMWELLTIIFCQGTSHWPKVFSSLHFRLKVYYPVSPSFFSFLQESNLHYIHEDSSCLCLILSFTLHSHSPQ